MTEDLERQIQRLKATYGDPITKSWSASFEEEPYPNCPDQIIADAVEAIRATHPVDDGHAPFVNLVTPAVIGDPTESLLPAIQAAVGFEVKFEYIGQCGCGGYVVRAWNLSS